MSTAVRRIRGNIRRARLARTQSVNQAQNLYNRSVGDANYVGAEVGDYLNNMNGQINTGYDQAGGNMAAARAALQQQMASTTDQNESGINSELSRLGIQQTGTGNIRSDANNAMLSAQAQGTNEQANNTSSKANAGAVGQLLLGMNQGQRQANLGNLLNARNDTIATARDRFQQERMAAKQSINEILAQQAASRAYSRSHSYSSNYHPYKSYGSGGSSTQSKIGGQLALTKAIDKKKRGKVQGLLGKAPHVMESSLASLFTAGPLG